MNNPRRAPKKHRRSGPVRLGGRPPAKTIPRRLSARCDEALHTDLLTHCKEHDVSRTAAIRKAVRSMVDKSLAVIARDLLAAKK